MESTALFEIRKVAVELRIEEDTIITAWKFESRVIGAPYICCGGVDRDKGVFEVFIQTLDKVVRSWQAQLELNPGNCDIVEETIGILQSKYLSLSKEW